MGIKHSIFSGVRELEARKLKVQKLKGHNIHGIRYYREISLKRTPSAPRGNAYDYSKKSREEEFVHTSTKRSCKKSCSKCLCSTPMENATSILREKKIQTSPICSYNLTKNSERAKVLKDRLLLTHHSLSRLSSNFRFAS